MSSISRVGRLARTVARLHPAQVVFRPIHLARTALLSRSSMAAGLLAGTPAVRAGAKIVTLEGSLESSLPGVAPELAVAERALAGKVELVGRTLPLRPPQTDFLAPEEPRLVRYQLGYLGVARALAVAARTAEFAEADAAMALAVAHVREFVERVPPGRGEAWEPYVVATRLLNLVVMRELVLPIASEGERAFLDGALLASLGQHARWLVATLELHLLGNHLFTDGAALFVAGCVLDLRGARAMRSVGQAIVARSLATDVLSDGGHAERSPMYQATYLDQLELVLAAARASGQPEPPGARASAARIASQLVAISHPDGDIPLCGDSALQEVPLPADLAAPFGLGGDSLRQRLFGTLDRAAAVEGELLSFPRTGLYVSRGPGEHLLLDAGPLGTRDQPGHAHADALSFELSHRGRRLIVDGGAGHYADDEARAYFRGPFAHSSVSVDGEGPDEVWASFRAGARGRVEPVVVSRVGELRVLRGAVRAAAGWRAERLVFHAPGELVAVFDRVEHARPGADVLSHILWAPEVRLLDAGPARLSVEPSGGPALSLVRLAGGSWRTRRGETSPFRGWSAARLGRFEPSCAVELAAARLAGAWTAGWALVTSESARVQGESGGVLLAAGGARVRVAVDGRGLRWEEL